MTQQEIQERNKEIALMRGWKEATLKYKIKWCGVKTEDRLNRLDKDFVPILMKENEEPLWEDSLRWHSDWNWLMESVEFIKKNIKSSSNTRDAKIGELFIDKWEFKVKSYYVRLIQWTKNGWRMPDRDDMELSLLYIIGENCESEKEALFLIVSDIAKLYNEKKL